MADRNELARHRFRQRMTMKRMGIDPDKNTIVYGDKPAPKKELTEEEKAQIERKRREEEEKQRIGRIKSLEKSIPMKNAQYKLHEKTIARMNAEMELLLNVDLKEENNEWKGRSIQTQIDSMALDMDQMKADLENEKAELQRMQEELARLKKLMVE